MLLRSGEYTTTQYNSSRYKMRNSKNVSFTGNPTRKIVDAAKKKIAGVFLSQKVEYNDAEKLINDIDALLGENFFRNKIDKSNAKILQNGKLTYEDAGLLKLTAEAFKNITYDLYYKTLAKIKELNPSIFQEKTAQKIDAQMANFERQRNTLIVDDIVKNYIKNEKDFALALTKNTTKTTKAYETRYERVLNKLATSTVSAIFASNDYYNLSLLRKDDHEDAEKAGKVRIKQDFKKMGINAALLYLTLSVFDKYVKSNVYLNALVVAATALISDVFSRTTSGIPIIPLTPEQAAKIAQKQKGTKGNVSTQVSLKDTTKNPTTKETLNNLSNNSAFVHFTNKKGVYSAIEKMKQRANEKPKRKYGLINTFVGALLYCSITKFIAGKPLRDETKLVKNLMKKYGKDVLIKIKDKSASPEVMEEFTKGINDILTSAKGKKSIGKYYNKFKKWICTTKEPVTYKNFVERINKLKEQPDGKIVTPVLNKYLEMYEKCPDKDITMTKNKFLIANLYEGFEKIFQLFHSTLSVPAACINNLLCRFQLGKGNYQHLDSAKKAVEPNLISTIDKTKKAIGDFCKIINDDFVSDWEIVNSLKKNIRNFETKAETGELANASRNMITLISTYFFVNDYRNRVLIESEGKDIEGAKAERNDRIAHKASNFIINGTLMNLFNSTFKGPLNKSLIAATAIAAATETTNESLIRKSICQPISRKDSKQEILDFENEQMNKKGLFGWWAKFYKKITGKKTLSEKA